MLDHLGTLERRLLATTLIATLGIGLFLFWWYQPLQPGLSPCGDNSRVELADPEDFRGWPRRCDEIEVALIEFDLPPVQASEELVHIHSHLRILIRGEEIEVPGGVGIDGQGRPVSPVHTHTPDGLIHVESPVDRTYHLGDLMGVWGVSLTNDCIDTLCTSDENELVIYVDGIRYEKPLAEVELENLQSIVVTFDARSETKPSIEVDVDWTRWDI